MYFHSTFPFLVSPWIIVLARLSLIFEFRSSYVLETKASFLILYVYVHIDVCSSERVYITCFVHFRQVCFAAWGRNCRVSLRRSSVWPVSCFNHSRRQLRYVDNDICASVRCEWSKITHLTWLTPQNGMSHWVLDLDSARFQMDGVGMRNIRLAFSWKCRSQ